MTDLKAELARIQGLFNVFDKMADSEKWFTFSAALSLAERAIADNERLRTALAEIREEWAGAECGKPVHAQEAYAIELARRMFRIAAAAIAARQPRSFEDVDELRELAMVKASD